MKSLDKVTEAYYGGMGEKFARKTRERIHWICSKAQGKHVLDIGCSQGIMELLLAREGKRIIGIDIEDEAIKYAQNALVNESDAIKRNVEYRVSSIFEFESNTSFETVILAEVMEHFSSTTSLLKTVYNLMTEDGTLVVTVPFGINDFIDHKKTYYISNLLEEIEPLFRVSEVKFFGKWLGLVAKKETNNSNGSSIFSRDLIKQLEECFYTVERALVDDAEVKVNQIKKFHAELAENRKTIDHIKQENDRLKHENDLLKEENDRLKQEAVQKTIENEELRAEFCNIKDNYNKPELNNNKLTTAEDEIKKYKQKIADLEQIIESKNKEILKRLDSEETTLKRYKDAIFNNNQLEAKYSNISKKYDLLSKAKLGKLTLNYWKFKKRIPQDF